MDPNQNTKPNIDPKAQAIADNAMSAAMDRVAYALTEADMAEIEKLDQDDKDGKKVAEYILTRVPNFEAVLAEETIKALNPEDKNSSAN